jgi:serine protease
MSLGGSNPSRTEAAAFAQAASDGILPVAAAGNAGNTTKSYPASYPDVVSVAAVDRNKALASFSQRNDEVDLAAPGVAVLSTTPWASNVALAVGGATFSGLSMEGSAGGTATGLLANGGLCSSAGNWTGMVVLCQRGSITFRDKVRNVARGGGVAAVVYNNVEGNFSGTLGNAPVDIVAISLSQADGQAALAYLGQSATVTDEIVTPGSSYEEWDGTSMATPHVAGVAALIWSYFPGKTAAQIRAALTSTAEDLGAPGRDNSFGHGLIRAKNALDALAGP